MTVSTSPYEVVLASARTIMDMTGSSCSRSNSNKYQGKFSLRSNSSGCHDRCPYRSRCTHRELPTVDTETDVVACPVRFSGGVLASARTIMDMTGSSRFRSNSKGGNGRRPYRSRCTHRELLNVDIETDPVVLASARTVKKFSLCSNSKESNVASRFRSNGKGCRLVVSHLLSL